MLKTTGRLRRGRRANHVLAAALGAALALPSLAAANALPPSPAAPAPGDTAPAWPGPWTRTDVQRLVVTEAVVGNGKIPAALALAVAEVESDFVPRTIGAGGAVGIMQILPAIAKSELGADVAALKDPATNVRLGLRWLARLHERYDGDWELALSHFRGGKLMQVEGRYRPHEYTRSYVRRVMRCWRSYERDPLVQAWIRDANGAPRFVAGGTGTRLEARTAGGWDAHQWWHAHVPYPYYHHHRERFRAAHLPCDEPAAWHEPVPHRFNGGGRWTAIEGTPSVRHRYEGPWVPVTGAGGGRFR